jgi:hypothetical protein
MFFRYRVPQLTESPKPKIVRQTFSAHEDVKLKELVPQFGQNDWPTISAQINNRTSRQCKERYKSYLAPGFTSSPWTDPEAELLRTKYYEIGAKWAQLAAFFPGRSDANLKNRWSVIGGMTRRHPVSILAFESPLPEQDTAGNSRTFQTLLTQANPPQVTNVPVVPNVPWMPGGYWPPNPDDAPNIPRIANTPPPRTKPGGGMLDLWAIDLRPPEPGSREDRWGRIQLSKTFPNHGGWVW